MCIAGDQPHRSFAASRVDGRPERRRITAWKQLDALFFQCRVELGQIAFIAAVQAKFAGQAGLFSASAPRPRA